MFVFFNTVVRTTGEAASTAAEKFSFSSLSQEMSLRGNTMSDAHSHNIFLEDKTEDGVTLLVSSERATGPPQSSSSAMFPLYHWFRPRKCWIPLPGNSSIIFKIINRTHSVPSQSTTQTRQQQRRGTKSSHIVSWKTSALMCSHSVLIRFEVCFAVQIYYNKSPGYKSCVLQAGGVKNVTLS